MFVQRTLLSEIVSGTTRQMLPHIPERVPVLCVREEVCTQRQSFGAYATETCRVGTMNSRHLMMRVDFVFFISHGGLIHEWKDKLLLQTRLVDPGLRSALAVMALEVTQGSRLDILS